MISKYYEDLINGLQTNKPRLEKREPEPYARIGQFIYTKPEVVMVFLTYALGGAFLFWLGYMAVMSGGI